MSEDITLLQRNVLNPQQLWTREEMHYPVAY